MTGNERRDGIQLFTILAAAGLALMALLPGGTTTGPPGTEASTVLLRYAARVMCLLAAGAPLWGPADLRHWLGEAFDVARGRQVDTTRRAPSIRQSLVVALMPAALVWMATQRHGEGFVATGPMVLSVVLAGGLLALLRYASAHPERVHGLAAVLRSERTGGANRAQDRALPNALWLGIALLVLVGAAVSLERAQPYYFTQDDNLVELQPLILCGCRTARAGAFASWSPSLFLGMPLAETAAAALTYPPTYISYAVATYGLGDEYATLEVFCWMHLLIGLCGCWWLGRRLGVSAPLSATLAVCFALSGFALIGGRSWYMMTATMPFFHLFSLTVGALVLDRLARDWLRRPSLTPLAAAAAMVLMLYHAQRARPSFYSYAAKPYPPLPGALTELASGPESSRVVTAGPARSIDPNYLSCLPHNVAVVHEVSALGGSSVQVRRGDNWRELLHSYERAPLEMLRELGVTHVILSTSIADERAPALSLHRTRWCSTVSDEIRLVRRPDSASMHCRIRPRVHSSRMPEHRLPCGLCPAQSRSMSTQQVGGK